MGCDGNRPDQQISAHNFNPRTHRGVRLARCTETLEKTRISIHAPIVGCDDFKCCGYVSEDDFNPRTHRGVRPRKRFVHRQTNINFNPRTHRGVRRQQAIDLYNNTKFQSTHPSWGATFMIVRTM